MSLPLIMFEDYVTKYDLLVTTTAGMETNNPLSNCLIRFGPKKAVTSLSPFDLGYQWTIRVATTTKAFKFHGIAVIGTNRKDELPSVSTSFMRVEHSDETELLNIFSLPLYSNRRPRNLYGFAAVPTLVDVGDYIDIELSWPIDPSMTGDNFSISRLLLMNCVYPEEGTTLCLGSQVSVSVIEQASVQRTPGEQAHGPTSRRRRRVACDYEEMTEFTVQGTGDGTGQLTIEYPMIDLAYEIGSTEECVFAYNSEPGWLDGDGEILMKSLQDTAVYGTFSDGFNFSRNKDGTWTLPVTFDEILT